MSISKKFITFSIITENYRNLDSLFSSELLIFMDNDANEIYNFYINKTQKKYMKQETLRTLMAKLSKPLHIDFISSVILQQSIEKTKEIMDKLVDEGVIEETPNESGYYNRK